MSDITEAFGPKWKSNRVQKLFTTRGKEVKGVADFFREDDCFIALGGERLRDNEVADIIDELFPDSAYAKMLLKEWEKQRRRERKANNAAKEGEEDKKDSGFAEGSDTTHRDQDGEGQSTNRSQRPTHRSKRAAAVALASERDSLMGSESGSPQGYYMLNKLERERKQAAASEDREKARKREKRLAEQERRAIEENRRRRGLNPLNPLKPLDDIRRKEPVEKEELRKRKEEEARKKIEEEKEAERLKKEREEREQAEKAARERMAAAEKAERERLEQENKEREEAAKAEKEAKPESETAEKEAKPTENKAEVDKEDKEKETGDKDMDAESVKEKPEKKRKKDKDNVSEKNTGRKQKAKVVRRSKTERQVSSDSFVSERYELGRTLGDGNFAIVRTSRQKASGQEFAMKVIDKPKLKGKEQMVENEIDIMKDCNHPNIVKLYEEYETKDKIYLVMELVKVREHVCVHNCVFWLSACMSVV